jgi:hypothetical protein
LFGQLKLYNRIGQNLWFVSACGTGAVRNATPSTDSFELLEYWKTDEETFRQCNIALKQFIFLSNSPFISLERDGLIHVWKVNSDLDELEVADRVGPS